MQLKFVEFEPDPIDLLSMVMLGGGGQQVGAIPKEPLNSVIHSAFDILCQELGIANDPRTVNVSFLGHISEGTDGRTYNDHTDPFKVVIKIESPHETLSTFAHEMVHVKDLALGILVQKGDDLFYKGQKLNGPMASILTKAQLQDVGFPHEREAYALMYPLTFKVLEGLSPEHKAYLNRVYAQSLEPPTLAEYYNRQQGLQEKRTAQALTHFEAYKRKRPDSPLAKFASLFDVMTANPDNA